MTEAPSSSTTYIPNRPGIPRLAWLLRAGWHAPCEIERSYPFNFPARRDLMEMLMITVELLFSGNAKAYLRVWLGLDRPVDQVPESCKRPN